MTAESNKKHFEEIAGNTLDVLAKVSAEADRELSTPPPLSAEALSRNTFTDQNVVTTAARHNEDRLRTLQTIADEPAIARIVARNDQATASANCRIHLGARPFGIARRPRGHCC